MWRNRSQRFRGEPWRPEAVPHASSCLPPRRHCSLYLLGPPKSVKGRHGGIKRWKGWEEELRLRDEADEMPTSRRLITAVTGRQADRSSVIRRTGTRATGDAFLSPQA